MGSLPALLLLSMVKILFWNACGASGEKFRSAIVDLVKIHNVDILAVCEPRGEFCKASDTLLKLGFIDYHIIEVSGFSGGIWQFWNCNNLSVNFVDALHQAISIKITLPGGHAWMLTTLYASPSIRCFLWNYLECLVSTHQLPWVFIGDFKELYSSSDENFGCLTGRFGDLKQWVDNNALIDMGFQGSCYNWTNNRIKERLVRGFCTCDWRTIFSGAFIRHLSRMKCDQCPILLQLHSNNTVNRQATPFRFQAMWLTHNNFSSFVSNTWNSLLGSFMDKTANFSKAMQRWNLTTFGNIF